MDIYEKNGTTPEQFTEIVTKLMNILAPDFIFGYHDREDIKHQGFIIALKVLHDGKYDKNRPLDNFLYVHLQNRLKNYVRDNNYRYESPCLKCPLYDKNRLESDNQCKGFTDRLECEKFKSWKTNNDRKANIMKPAQLEEVHSDNYATDVDLVLNGITRQELIDLIDKNLQSELRPDFLRMLAGIRISPKRSERIRAEVKRIINESGDFPEILEQINGPETEF